MAGIYSWVVGGRNQPALAVKAGVPPPHSGGVPGVCSAGEGQRLCTSNDDSAVLYCRAEKRARQRAAQTAHRPGAEDAVATRAGSPRVGANHTTQAAMPPPQTLVRENHPSPAQWALWRSSTDFPCGEAGTSRRGLCRGG
eukprot:CAMPEP_0174356928 /NCGR_PEP_ID=MMETSP0811_2-20130205/32932_1 /TAXON_ID=73025 ORGANISM="Eutreptiella gymnastica-like, Strain CCMP1594" /NCGR_SAMPLE_ID=MMETSP0811_2 /ASSEMBLY_ACC=CAM_ASM_000667 /LENGTH=139 /DNA_ID=CAMNT_0015489287 /DNA_START=419 /DNA_END=837 /DNA_ORIENTATION=+